MDTVYQNLNMCSDTFTHTHILKDKVNIIYTYELVMRAIAS